MSERTFRYLGRPRVGDLAFVVGRVAAVNVGGQVKVSVVTFNQGEQIVWADPYDNLRLAEPWSRRTLRRLAHWLARMAEKLNPDFEEVR